MRSLISTVTQKLFVGIDRSVTPESPIIRQPWVGNLALAGAAANAIPTSEPRVTFTAWAASQALLGTLTAVLQTTIYPSGADTAPYTMTEDVTGTFLLGRGTLVYDLDPWAVVKVGLVLTNRHTAAQTIRVQTQLHGVQVVVPGEEGDVQTVRVVA